MAAKIDKIIKKHKGCIFLLLDFDGTLSTIVKKPEIATLSKGIKPILRSLANNKRSVILGIISGRELKNVKKKVGINNIYYAGNHGLEISGPGITFTLKEAKAVRPIIKNIRKELRRATGEIKGVMVEDKGFSLSLHYRLIKSGDLQKVKKAFVKIMSKHVARNKIRINYGKKVFEVKPKVNWDKGKASLLLLKLIRSKKKNILPVYIGDDRTDEDAFTALKGKGVTILVGSHGGKTSAKYRLKNVSDVTALLKRVNKLYNNA
ncbi:trehalose-phosphatase [Candidatus Margulisiibacteriota bacterium]